MTRGGIDIGRVQRYIEHREPGLEGKIRYVIDAKWYVIPEGGRDWNPAIRHRPSQVYSSPTPQREGKEDVAVVTY